MGMEANRKERKGHFLDQIREPMAKRETAKTKGKTGLVQAKNGSFKHEGSRAKPKFRTVLYLYSEGQAQQGISSPDLTPGSRGGDSINERQEFARRLLEDK